MNPGPIPTAPRTSSAPPRPRASLRHAGSAAALAIVLLAAAPSHAASRVFYDGFEAGNTNLWSSEAGRNKCIAVRAADDAGTPRAGGYMMKCNWNGTVAWDDPNAFTTVVLPSWNYTNEFLMRFWYRADRNVDAAPGSKMLRMGFATRNETFWSTQFEQATPSLFMSWTISGVELPNYWGSPQSAIGDRNWHKIEVYIKHDTNGTDGIIRVWVDGNRVYDQVNIRSHASGANWWPLNIPSNWSNNAGWSHDANNAIYFDEFEIYSDVGTGASGQLSDASASVGTQGPSAQTLGAPSNLRLAP